MRALLSNCCDKGVSLLRCWLQEGAIILLMCARIYKSVTLLLSSAIVFLVRWWRWCVIRVVCVEDEVRVRVKVEVKNGWSVAGRSGVNGRMGLCLGKRTPAYVF